MEYVIIGFVLFILVTSLVIILHNKNESNVLNNSEKIRLINIINAEFTFNELKSKIIVKKHYDNKSYFNKIEPAYLMSSYLRTNATQFAHLIQKIKENQILFAAYQDRIAEVRSQPTNIQFSKTKIIQKSALKKEKKFIKQLILQPVIDLKLCFYMSYSSPAGQVNISKKGCFDFQDVFFAFESVSRTYLDKDTYRELALVTRGEVSDSLRYDVLKSDDFKCVICGASAKDGVRLHVDHIIPVSKGGSSKIENLRTLCERCNVGKSNKIEN